MEFWITQIFNGISFGALLFLLASGLSLIFGVMRIVNIAHGSYYLLGAYVGLSVARGLGPPLAAPPSGRWLALAILCGAGIVLVGALVGFDLAHNIRRPAGLAPAFWKSLLVILGAALAGIPGYYVGLSVIRGLAPPGGSLSNPAWFGLALLAGAVAVAVIGVGMERWFLRRFRVELSQMLLTMGFALIFQDLALIIWGGDPYTVPTPEILSGSVRTGALTFPVYRFFVVAMAVVVGLFLWLLQDRTRVGAMIRAAVDDAEMAGGVGINVPLVSAGVFALGAFLAAVGGVMGGAFLGIFPGADFEVLPFAFVVVIVGGLGSLKGAFVGSMLVGVVDNFGKALLPELSYFTLFAPMALVLALRPTGLFGRA